MYIYISRSWSVVMDEKHWDENGRGWAEIHMWILRGSCLICVLFFTIYLFISIMSIHTFFFLFFYYNVLILVHVYVYYHFCYPLSPEGTLRYIIHHHKVRKQNGSYTPISVWRSWSSCYLYLEHFVIFVPMMVVWLIVSVVLI
jgi:hypothetical protein